ncbi:MAG: glycosyltransferase family 4 protein [Bacteroidales bacterium]|nr:glycosyltransferase family 4 protein [Bacteroidales bacterium]
MKVLMFGWEFPPHISGGLGTACYGITRGLSKIGDVELVFVVPKAFGNEYSSNLELISAEDVPVNDRPDLLKKLHESCEYIEADSALIPYINPDEFRKQAADSSGSLKSHKKSASHGRLQFSGKYGLDLFSEISNYALIADTISRAHHFDIIHAHDWLTYPAGIAAKKASGKPLVVHVHATDFDRSGGKVNPRVFEIERKGMDAADKVITVSQLTRKIVLEKYDISPGKVETVYNAVEPVQEWGAPRYCKSTDEKIVTFLGRITLQKGPEYFVDAACMLLDKTDKLRFVMAGSGDLMQKMVSRTAELGIANKFHFTGFLEGHEVFKLLQISDVYVMPSVSEPFGISSLEAMQSSVPVVISRQSGVSEILTHAIKVDFWDVEALADAIYGLIKYPALSKMLINGGKREADALKWEDSARHMYQIYTSLMRA